MGAGMHGYNGINPEIIMKVWNTYIHPRLVFGLDSIMLTKKDIHELSHYHHTLIMKNEIFWNISNWLFAKYHYFGLSFTKGPTI
jgi:hypothetical protein